MYTITRKTKQILFVFLTIALTLTFRATASEGFLVKTNPETFMINIDYFVSTPAAKPEALVVEMPLPSSNAYQDVVLPHPGDMPGSVLHYPETNDAYMHLAFGGKDFFRRENFGASYEFEVTLYDIAVDFGKITTLYDYDTSTDMYKQYTKANGEHIQPRNPDIVRIAAELGSDCDDLEFARRAYDYVARNFEYYEDNRIKRIDVIFADGRGNCGSLSSVFISLLRNRGIPARHLVGYKKNEKAHIFSEFYLENYGWVPVDVTYRNTNPNTDYFGRIRKDDAMVVLSRDINLTLRGLTGGEKVNAMQKGRFRWSGQKGDMMRIVSTFNFACAPMKEDVMLASNGVGPVGAKLMW